MSGKQAYAGTADRQDGTSEYNRIALVVRQMLAGQAVATPVIVRAVSDDGKNADVQPMVAQLDGAGNATPHGIIHNLPVWQLGGGVNAVIVAPVVGDMGLAVFCHTDISSVKKTKAPGNPGSRRRNDYADGVYLGGLQWGPDPTQFIRLSGSGIEITAPTVVVSDNLTVGNGASGVFTSADGKTITVVSGIITGIA